MALIRIELSGRVVKPPKVGLTPSGRAVLRLSVDCGEDPEHLLIEVVLVDNAARDLARRSANPGSRNAQGGEALWEPLAVSKLRSLQAKSFPSRWAASPEVKRIYPGSLVDFEQVFPVKVLIDG